MNFNSTGPFEIHYQNAASVAATLELRLRMCAGKSSNSALKKASVDSQLSDVLKALKEERENALTDNEWKHLELAIKVRNKLLHCELHKIMDLLKLETAGVSHIDFKDTNDLLKKMSQIQQHGKKVVNSSTKEAGIIGWLLEFGASGSFKVMETVFTEGNLLASKLAKSI